MSFSNPKNAIVFFLLMLPFWNFSQITIKGNIKDKETGKPIETAYVFIANTNLGTISDAEGKFALTNIPIGKVHIVISHLSYQVFSKKLSFLQAAEYDWNIKLKSEIVDLQNISVTAKKSNKRKKYLKKFKKAFLGASANAKLCHIRNMEVLRFEEKDKMLYATAKDLLKIENFALGYRIYFYLEKFKLKENQVSYSGKPLFEELVPKSAAQKKLWEKNRAVSYYGSLQHFYQSIINTTTQQDGFKVYKAKLNANKVFELSTPINIKTLVESKTELNETWLKIPDFLKVVYTLEKDKISPTNSHSGASSAQIGLPAEREMMLQGSNNLREEQLYQHSYLFSLQHLIRLDANAVPEKAEQIKEYGYWSYERIAELLPQDYRPSKLEQKKINANIQQEIPSLNGFKLKELLIPVKEIHQGGPPKDGIPSIDNPLFINVEEVDFIQDDEEVISVIMDGIAKAYPIKILNFHELVNDQINGKAILVSYCPLCGSGIVFSREIAQKKRSFGVSGLLYNSDVLLYDRETESLWSQIMGQAIAGIESGKKLQMLPSSISTWGAWKDQHPQGKVLSTQTGFIKDYTKNPYQAYEKSNRLMFPVKHKNKSLTRKAKVLGIEYQGKYKAYPLKVFANRQSPIIDQWEGQEIHIYFDLKKGTTSVKDAKGNPLVATRMYWFAWYAFHPDTEIYQQK